MISIITPVYNNRDKLERFLESVESEIMSSSGSFETIVVDDGSSVDLKKTAEKFAGVRYIRLDGHPGPAAARNRGAEAARGEYLVFFDSDVTLKPQTLKRFSEDFDAGETAVVGEYDIEPMTDGFFARFKAILTESWTPADRYVSVFALRAAGIKKETFGRVGGFDESIKTASVEDFEFGDRLAGIGVKIYYDPQIVVRHHHPAFLKQMRLFYLRSKDWAELFMKRGGRFDNWCANPSEGVASIFGTIFAASLFAACFTKGAFFPVSAALSFAVYAALNAKFLKIAHRRRGLLFMPVALLVKLPLSISITTGFAAGAWRFFMTGITNRPRK